MLEIKEIFRIYIVLRKRVIKVILFLNVTPEILDPDEEACENNELSSALSVAVKT
jgi:hypothetical protein